MLNVSVRFFALKLVNRHNLHVEEQRRAAVVHQAGSPWPLQLGWPKQREQSKVGRHGQSKERRAGRILAHQQLVNVSKTFHRSVAPALSSGHTFVM